ncbi:hypothetical protein B0H15DRAFT_121032 [Mycena belliarum]|uniref:Uncharacterized protein n=1 Tax=Mycena belliarum TaxID=1033014 RepID=A0AAD6TQ45_9AGAR|nr:hypothetical protein B0H15DRAFT_121032 [Mycena belliae]
MGGAHGSGFWREQARDWTLIASDVFWYVPDLLYLFYSPFIAVVPLEPPDIVPVRRCYQCGNLNGLIGAYSPPIRAAALALSHLRLGKPLRARARHERQGTRQRSPTAVLPTRTLVYIPAHRARAESLRSASNGPVCHRRHPAHPPKPFGPTCSDPHVSSDPLRAPIPRSLPNCPEAP